MIEPTPDNTSHYAVRDVQAEILATLQSINVVLVEINNRLVLLEARIGRGPWPQSPGGD